jgi:hypothetical protein
MVRAKAKDTPLSQKPLTRDMILSPLTLDEQYAGIVGSSYIWHAPPSQIWHVQLVS